MPTQTVVTYVKTGSEAEASPFKLSSSFHVSRLGGDLGSAIKQTAAPFFCAVMLSSWYGGLWLGVFAGVLSVVALDYFFVPPLYALGIGPEDAVDMIAFVATALFISWLNSEQNRAKESIRRARDKLDARVKERTADLKMANQQLQAEVAEREAAENRLFEAQNEIARIARITTMGELAASIAFDGDKILSRLDALDGKSAYDRHSPESVADWASLNLLSKNLENTLCTNIERTEPTAG